MSRSQLVERLTGLSDMGREGTAAGHEPRNCRISRVWLRAQRCAGLNDVLMGVPFIGRACREAAKSPAPSLQNNKSRGSVNCRTDGKRPSILLKLDDGRPRN